jgi:hypothetical protein
VLVGVDLVGQFLFGLVGHVTVALLLEHFEDLVFRDLHGVLPVGDSGSAV